MPYGDQALAVSTYMLADALAYQQAAVTKAPDPQHIRPQILIADAVGLGKTLEIGMIPHKVVDAAGAIGPSLSDVEFGYLWHVTSLMLPGSVEKLRLARITGASCLSAARLQLRVPQYGVPERPGWACGLREPPASGARVRRVRSCGRRSLSIVTTTPSARDRTAEGRPDLLVAG